MSDEPCQFGFDPPCDACLPCVLNYAHRLERRVESARRILSDVRQWAVDDYWDTATTHFHVEEWLQEPAASAPEAPWRDAGDGLHRLQSPLVITDAPPTADTGPVLSVECTNRWCRYVTTDSAPPLCPECAAPTKETK